MFTTEECDRLVELVKNMSGYSQSDPEFDRKIEKFEHDLQLIPVITTKVMHTTLNGAQFSPP